MPPAGEPGVGVSSEETPSAVQPAKRVEPVLSARDENDREGGADELEKGDAPEKEESGPDGLTDEQRAKLAAARQPKPRRGFRTKILFILVIVAGLLLLALYALPPDILGKAGLESKQPADVGEVDAVPVPAEPEEGGHIVGGEPPAQPVQPAQ